MTGVRGRSAGPLAGTALVGLLLLAGCGDGPSDHDSRGAGPSAGDEAVGADDAVGGGAGDHPDGFDDFAEAGPDDDEIVTRPPTPLEDAFGLLTDPAELSEVYGQAYHHHAEHIRACLAGEGFGSFRVEPWTTPTPAEFGILGSDTDALDRFGYGVTGSLRAQVDHLTAGAATDGASGDGGTDNQQYLDSLTGAELDAFRQVMDACTTEAWDRYPLPDTYPAAVADDLAALHADAAGSPEVTAAWDQWSGCMADAGYRYASRDDAVADVQASAAEVSATVGRFLADGSTPGGAQLESLGATITEVERFERRVVDADVDCADEAGVSRHLDEAVIRAETEWLEANGDRVALALADEPPPWWED